LLLNDTLSDVSIRGLRHLYHDPDAETFVSTFWERECRNLAPVQRRNLLFGVYEEAWRRAEAILGEAKEAPGLFEAQAIAAVADRYFAVFKNLGEYLGADKH
jgi:hypothetical protein